MTIHVAAAPERSFQLGMAWDLLLRLSQCSLKAATCQVGAKRLPATANVTSGNASGSDTGNVGGSGSTGSASAASSGNMRLLCAFTNYQVLLLPQTQILKHAPEHTRSHPLSSPQSVMPVRHGAEFCFSTPCCTIAYPTSNLLHICSCVRGPHTHPRGLIESA